MASLICYFLLPYNIFFKFETLMKLYLPKKDF